MTIKMTAEEYQGVIKYLLSLPMNRADKPMLAHLYAGGGIPEVLGETSKELRARVAMNAVKAHCDTKKTPAPAATGNGGIDQQNNTSIAESEEFVK